MQQIDIVTSVLPNVHTNETSIRKRLKLMSIKFVWFWILFSLWTRKISTEVKALAPIDFSLYNYLASVYHWLSTSASLKMLWYEKLKELSLKHKTQTSIRWCFLCFPPNVSTMNFEKLKNKHTKIARKIGDRNIF